MQVFTNEAMEGLNTEQRKICGQTFHCSAEKNDLDKKIFSKMRDLSSHYINIWLYYIAIGFIALIIAV